MNQITIKDAFAKCNKIEIEYIRVAKCSSCGSLTDVYVPEKNFSGTEKQFTAYSKRNPNITLDVLVEEDPLEPGLYFYEELDLDVEDPEVFCEECDEDDFFFF